MQKTERQGVASQSTSSHTGPSSGQRAESRVRWPETVIFHMCFFFFEEQAGAIDFFNLKPATQKGKEPIGRPAFSYEVHKDSEIGADVTDGLRDAAMGSVPLSVQAQQDPSESPELQSSSDGRRHHHHQVDGSHLSIVNFQILCL